MTIEYELSRLCSGEKYVKIKSPTWSDVLFFLERLESSSGGVYIRIIDPSEFGPERLSVEGENGFYLVTLLEYDESGGDVRSIWDDTSSSKENIIILGNYWPKRQLTKDFDHVTRIFKEFFDTGNVSTDVLN
ncbi:DUF6911 family protein [Kalamiella sp. sgz302252]|uniref:DUF6911 family protein n=1 Tax=Pantoea sp. sgz302252 TaxID=3341827 RepID=UPI0036D36DE1